VRRVRDKLAFRRLLREREFPCPEFHHLPSGEDPQKLFPELKFPVVVKARRLSGSRGVIRADDSEGLVRAVHWVRAIQTRADRDAQELGLIIEDFIPGHEHALEGTLESGELTTLALFDKPDPLDGPYFEETIYVTPSRLPEVGQVAVADCAARAARALGLIDGPVHAELRINDTGPWLIELAARSIGGLCARTLRFGTGMTLEEIILRHALGWPIASLERERPAAGVMMIPIPRGGILHGVDGLDQARAVPGIEDITISMHTGQRVVPLPEGSEYLGFIFSRAASPDEAEASLRRAHGLLRFRIAS
jgi:biotin carboxylase